VPLIASTSLTYRPITPLIGAVIEAGKDSLLSGMHAEDIRVLLERSGVLILPRVSFTDQEQIAFTRTLGQYEPDHADGSVTDITIDRSAGDSAEYTKSSFFWHFDGYMNDVPVLGSILSCVRPSPTGGNTEFCNTYAAWEALPIERKAALEGLRAVHALAGAQLSVEPEPSYATFSKWLKIRHRTLPLVWTHRSGRKSLVIGNTAVNVVDMQPLEGLELLVWLRDWATQERFTYSHSWSVGDAVLWDNTGTLHRATPYAAESGRLMRRTKLAGEEPFG
jgi:alpha-ketoglutarate-dependent taurine dioxygenase